MMNTSVLIYSCDAYSDVWGAFFTLFFRYWDCPYPVYVAAETEQCLLPKVKTINTDGTWTERMRKALMEIPTEYVICMCEDMFFRREVRQRVIDACRLFMDDNEKIACFNFEKEYDWSLPSAYPSFGRKPSGHHYQKSCQPSLWRRTALIELMQEDQSAWEWEMSSALENYEYYIWTGSDKNLVFEYGYHDHQWFGIQKGKWVAHDVVPLFKKEDIDIDFTIRGII